VLQGLAGEGIDLLGFDAALGTSPGAVVGAFVSTGGDLSLALASVQNLASILDPSRHHHGNARFLELMHGSDLTGNPEGSLRSVAHAAQYADTIGEVDYLALFDALDATPWPAALRIPAMDAATGELVVWDETSGIPLHAAVAASCALPMLFLPVTISGHSYVDGGLGSHLNATATAHAVDTLVLSCHPLRPAVAQDAASLTASETRAAGELEHLRQRTKLLPFEPDFTGIEATPRTMMSPEVARGAVTVGGRQAHLIAAAVSTVDDQRPGVEE
jgi:NTE family protein